MDGTLLPGTLLPSEDRLAAQFGVSRPTVRTAVRRLRASSLVTTERGRTGGHRVRTLGSWDIAQGIGASIAIALDQDEFSYAQLFEVRCEFELLSARTACRHRTDSDLDRLGELDTLEPVVSSRMTVEQALHYDMLFHRRLADCSHNPLISAISGATVVAFQHCGSSLFTDVDVTDILCHLDEVVVAVHERDEMAACDAMRRHLAIPRRMLSARPVDAADEHPG